jgi:uncharacterized protein
MYKSSYFNLLIPVPERNEYILFNTLSGGYAILYSEEGKIFRDRIFRKNNLKVENFSDNPNLFNSLAAGNYVVEEEKDEKEIYHKHYLKKKDSLFYNDKAKLILTIAPTNDCNMTCPYCFEFTKYKGIMLDKVIDQFIPFIKSVMSSFPGVKKWDLLYITWYGGEPLLAAGVIDELSKRFIEFSDSNGIEYKADIITNGLLLSRNNWEMLKRNRVGVTQVTVDGPKEIHDKSRPAKDKMLPNYETIMENISNVPDEIRITFRINVDKNVAANIDNLLDDLEARKIWPQKAKQMSLTAAWKRTYAERRERDILSRFSYMEFFEWEQKFRENKLKRYNRWAKLNNLPFAKLKWEIPRIQLEECWSIISPYNFVIDSEGYIHKCWENIQDRKIRLQHISESYDIKRYMTDNMLNYERFSLTKENSVFHNVPCNTCEYLPICGEPTCAQYMINNRVDCSSLKETTKQMLKNQYLIWSESPDKIDFEKTIRERSCIA